MTAASLKIKRLRSEALAFTESGDLRRALEKLSALEALDPADPDYPRRAAECHRQLGQRAEQLLALSRAANAYVNAGMVVKAMAICKVMLALDPKHPTALSWMSQLAPPLGVERIGGALAPLAPPRQRAPLPTPPARPDASESKTPRSLDPQQLVLERGLVAVARAVARKTGRNTRVALEPPADEAPWARPEPTTVAPAPPRDAVVPPPSPRRRITPAPRSAISLPPLSAQADVRHLVPGASSVAGARGKPSGMFQLVIDEGPPPTREELALRQVREVLPAVPVFSEVPPATLEVLVRQSRLLHFEPGDVVIRQDDAPDSLYVIVTGSVAVVDDAASELELYRLSENEIFGEAALISNEPWPTTVRATEACDLMAFDREAMRACISGNAAVVPVLLRFLRSRMVEHLVRTSPLFAHLPTEERRALTRQFQFIELEENALLVQEGERSPGLFVLLSGAVDVTRSTDEREHWLATLERGGVFGEMSLLSGESAVASVRCVIPGFALLLPAGTFRDVLMTHPPLHQVLTVMSEQRGQSNQRRIRER